MTDKQLEDLIDCDKLNTSKTFDETQHQGSLSIEDLLHLGFEKHIGAFELPESIKALMTVDDMNAVVSWYLKWKLSEPITTQTTCTIVNTFGYKDGLRAIVAINFFKYLRNKDYDPAIVEAFEKNNNMPDLYK